MSLPDPILLGNQASDPMPRINSAPGSASYRKTYEDGTVFKLTVFQTDNKKRARHVMRFDNTGPANAVTGVSQTSAITVTIDEPSSGAIPDSSLINHWGRLRDTMTDAIVTKMLNQEL